MKIDDFEGFPNPARVRIALAEKNVTDQVQRVHVVTLKGEHRLPAFVKLNPSASVPVLELDDGTCISECTAISEYISMVDITLFVGLNFADFAKVSIPADCTHLAAWRARMAARPSMAGYKPTH
jgi:glutathione S-transferase